jgi:hypothetical protein
VAKAAPFSFIGVKIGRLNENYLSLPIRPLPRLLQNIWLIFVLSFSASH